jgi:hypothetical protein
LLRTAREQMREKLICSQGDRHNDACSLAVAEFTEKGIVVLNRHSGRKHINLIPFSWILEEVMKNPELVDLFRATLDKEF